MHFHPLPKADYSSQRHFRHTQIKIITWEVILIDLMKAIEDTWKCPNSHDKLLVGRVLWKEQNGRQKRNCWYSLDCQCCSTACQTQQTLQVMRHLWGEFVVFHIKTSAHLCSRIIYEFYSNYRDSAGGISEASRSNDRTSHWREDKSLSKLKI